MAEAAYPWYPARDHGGERTAKSIRFGVVHCTATGESSAVAETIARRWMTDDGRIASAHVIADNDSTVRCVHDLTIAWHAKGANTTGLGLEIVGQATQTSVQWNDAYSRAAVRRGAIVMGDWCWRYRLPVRRLTIAQLRDGVTKGITSHADVEKAWPSTGHTDPGSNFPWASFLKQVQAHVDKLSGTPGVPDWYFRDVKWDPPIAGKDVEAVRAALGLPAGLGFDRELAAAIARYRAVHAALDDPERRYWIDKPLAVSLEARKG